MQRPDERESTSPLRMQGKQFADLHAGDVSLNRAKWPAIFDGRIRLHVVGFKLARPPPHPEQNHAGVSDLGLVCGGEEVIQSQPAQGKCSQAEEVATRTGAATTHSHHASSIELRN